MTKINQLRDAEQKKALNLWAKANFKGSIFAGTGFGKTRCGVIAAGETIIRNDELSLKPAALVLVPTTYLRDQFREEFIKWGYEDVLDNVEFMCYQSAYKLVGHHWDIVICDEIHLGLSPKYRKFFYTNIYDRLLCITATPPEEKEYRDYLKNLAPTVFKMTLDECVEAGFVAKYEIVCVSVQLTKEEKILYTKANKSFVHWKYELGQFDAFNKANEILKQSHALPSDKKKAIMFYRAIRNRKEIVDNASNKLLLLDTIINKYQGKKILTFGGSNEFTNKMCDAINGVSYHSGIPKKKRELNLELFKNNDVNILCSTKALNQGLDIPDAEMGIICGLTSKSLTMIQRVGRILRLKEGKIGRVIILYVADTQEEKWLNNSISTLQNIRKISNVNSI